ncbi:hypothetical protein T4B_1506 [Trichinella pseudospiralis]|uniref:Uncharacterized protein n=1 Tax=Trichinella pseudospiralis TaxID=6337 RepID=A0A0V1IET1_TRIPS|nr:hypothetical protein T4B_6261 [Trichinella pseudospiralis]KRZ00004.1 hypothetical protein T4B_870 [Trichinella pseudospiralis]KRZ00009.1 hypothetical protein T4B_13213 [Trichinella pseudospiralis]KRZ00094.1 hypothetical protein T4B_1506 [Trichinella pseudospiralis]KRZ21073.1 hypothetical protein T4C_10158 [Trichinella pseudospiralis]
MVLCCIFLTSVNAFKQDLCRVSSDLMPFLLTSSGQFCDRSVASLSTWTMRFSPNFCGPVLPGQMPLSCNKCPVIISCRVTFFLYYYMKQCSVFLGKKLSFHFHNVETVVFPKPILQPHSRYYCASLWRGAEPLSPDRQTREPLNR